MGVVTVHPLKGKPKVMRTIQQADRFLEYIFKMPVGSVCSVVTKIFSEISFLPLHVKGNNGFSMVTGLHPWCPLPPHPNPPPRRGEGGGDVFNVFFAMFRSINRVQLL